MMVKTAFFFILCCACVLLSARTTSAAGEAEESDYDINAGMLLACDDVVSCGIVSWRGFAALETFFFTRNGIYEGQGQNNSSLIINPELSYSWPSGNSITVGPYLLLDSRDSKRNQFDFRDLSALVLWDDWEFGLGMRTIYWGITESQQLIDIINQKDYLANIDGNEKFGQPMLSAAGSTDYGTFEIYVMPFFRERTYAGENGRLRFPLIVDTDKTRYESGAEEYHVDFAARYGQYIGDWEFGLSQFLGTARQPIFEPGLQNGITPVLVPYYEQISQTGLDLQVLLGEWLLKWESTYRDSTSTSSIAFTTGFEYTFTGIADTAVDCTMVMEWLYNDIDNLSIAPYDNDIMLSFRISFNDISSTEIKLGVTKDIEDSPAIYKLSAERRITDHWKLKLEGYLFSESEPVDAYYYIRDDDYVSLKLLYYF